MAARARRRWESLSVPVSGPVVVAGLAIGASCIVLPAVAWAVLPDQASPEATAQVARALGALRPVLAGVVGRPVWGAPGTLEHAISRYAPKRAWRVDEGHLGERQPGAGCPEGMALVHERVCVDAFENYVVERQQVAAEPDGEESVGDVGPGLLPATQAAVDAQRGVGSALLKAATVMTYALHSPYLPLDEHHVYIAVNQAGVVPQAYISAEQAASACLQAGKRLCSAVEWRLACGGRDGLAFPYGRARVPGTCNDAGRAVLSQLHPEKAHVGFGMKELNDPNINREPGTLATTGAYSACHNDFGLFDMVGNLHEWTADPNGTFQGGYYLDTHEHGDGCAYRTIAHGAGYHDYSTGFRCCAEPRVSVTAAAAP